MTKRTRRVAVIALLIGVSAVPAGILARRHQESAATKWTIEQTVPTVATVMPEQTSLGQQIVLPGDVEGWYESPIYARVNGYLKAWYFDFGAPVKKGQLHAEIDAPDLDDQFAAARAKLASAEAQVKLREAERKFAKTTYIRWRESPWGVVSEQATEAKKADFDSADARYKAAVGETNVYEGQLDELTARNTDTGALINAGSGTGGGNAPELFRVADVHRMRVFVRVPQEVSAGIRPGLTAEMTLPQYPNKTFRAIVSTTSDAINKTSRTLLVELHADNPDGLLQPGTFAKVRFKLPDGPGALRIPTSALIFREDGAQLAILGPGNKVKLRAVTLGRNLGTEFEVLKGIASSDTVIDRPPDSISQGEVVKAERETSPRPVQQADAK